MKKIRSFHLDSNHSPQNPPIAKPYNDVNNNAPRISNINPNQKSPLPFLNPKNKGTPFLSPMPRVPQKTNPRVNYFYHVPSKEEIIHLGRQNPQIVQYVMMQFKIPISSIEDFEAFVNSIQPNNVVILRNLQALFYQAIKNNPNSKNSDSSFKVATSPPVVQKIEYPFCDIRYFRAQTDQPMSLQPIQLGMSDFNFSIDIPPINSGNRIILQSFMANVNPPVVKWPQTLAIFINNILVKPPSIVHYSLIDLTCFGQVKSIRLCCSPEKDFFNIIIREASFRSFNDIVQELYNAPPSEEIFNGNELCLLCPLSGEMIKEPGKGRNCNHTQSFDLNAFLQVATFQRRWTCPICYQNLNFSDLIYSHETKKKIDMFKQFENDETFFDLQSADAFNYNDNDNYDDI